VADLGAAKDCCWLGSPLGDCGEYWFLKVGNRLVVLHNDAREIHSLNTEIDSNSCLASSRSGGGGSIHLLVELVETRQVLQSQMQVDS